MVKEPDIETRITGWRKQGEIKIDFQKKSSKQEDKIGKFNNSAQFHIGEERYWHTSQNLSEYGEEMWWNSAEISCEISLKFGLQIL
jgi:hypothetical protein